MVHQLFKRKALDKETTVSIDLERASVIEKNDDGYFTALIDGSNVVFWSGYTLEDLHKDAGGKGENGSDVPETKPAAKK